MSRTIILIRHCQAGWDASVKDHSRPLSASGQHAAPRLGEFLSQQGLVPDVALCSDALRTRQTWAGIADQLPSAPQVTLDPALYLAEPEPMLMALQANSAVGQTVAMIAHNPGIAALAWALAETPLTDDRFAQFVPGTVLAMRFEDAIAPGAGAITHFTSPQILNDPH